MSEHECTEHLLIQIDYLRTANRQLREYAEDATAKIKRLEEAGIVAIHEAVHGREQDALEIWKQAMEAKQ